MSALDQAFIKAYSKNPLSSHPAALQVEALRARPTSVPAADEHSFDALEAEIAPPPYRLDQPPPGSALPAPHARFARTGNSLRSRYTAPPPAEEFLPPAPAPVAQEYPELLPSSWRKKTLSLSKLARQLVGQAAAFVSDEESMLLVQDSAEPAAVREIEIQATGATRSTANVSANTSPKPATVDLGTQSFTASASASIANHLPLVTSTDLTAIILPQVVFDSLDTLSLQAAAAEPILTASGTAIETTATKPASTEKKRQVRFDAASPARGPHFGNKPEVVEVEAEAEEPAAEAIAPPAPALTPKVAAWEVDALDWPEVILKLTNDPTSYFAQAGQKLIDAVQDGLKMLAVAASQRGEGCTTIALALARIAAQSGLDVAIVDADFSHPEIAERLKVEIPAGWELATRQNIDLCEVAIHAVQDKLTIYSLQETGELSLATLGVQEVLAAVARRHALTIIDLGPLPAGDSPLLSASSATAIDAVVVVRDVARTPIDHLHSVAARLHASGIEAVAIAENFVS